MIGALNGTVLHVFEYKLIIEVGGVGYEVSVPSSIAQSLVGKEESTCRLYVTTYVRENEIRLFGFSELKAKQLFELLLSVSGIGPQTALVIVDRMTVEEFYYYVYAGDSGALVKVKGIGKKTAERMILELRDKIPQVAQPWPSAGKPASKPQESENEVFKDALSALVGLGYRRQEAAATLEKIPKGEHSVEALVRQSLGLLGKWKRT